MAPQGALQRFFHTIREYSGLEGTFKGYLILLVWFWSQGRGRCQSWVGEELGQALAVAQQSQGWGLWVKPGLGLILNPTGNELRKGLWFKHIPGCLFKHIPGGLLHCCHCWLQGTKHGWELWKNLGWIRPLKNH